MTSNHPIQWLERSIWTPDQCDKVIRTLDALGSDKAAVMGGKPGRSKARNCNITWVPKEHQYGWIYEDIERVFNEAADFFMFDIQEMQQLQYTTYYPWNYYKKHTDNGHSEVGVQTRKLSMSVNLSPPLSYSGGRLRIWAQTGRKTTKAQGTATVFPSFLWHQANTVWAGTRKALVAWAIDEEGFT